MSINELATIERHNLNIKIILLNNYGHGMCRHTQRQWLGGKYYATSIEGGLGMPQDWNDMVESFGIKALCHLEHLLDFCNDQPEFLEVMIDPDATLAFQVRYGEALA